MSYSKKEQLTIAQNKTHDEFTNYLTSIVGLKAPHHQTESLERRVQVFIRECMNAGFTCVYDCQDAEFLKMVIEKIRNHKDWSKYNKQTACWYTDFKFESLYCIPRLYWTQEAFKGIGIGYITYRYKSACF